jgi:predicted phosphoribosyltransferase
MEAAIWSARQEHPAKIIVALPVAPEDSLKKITGLADETVCLRVPANFFGVGQFYRDFAQVDDLEVLETLEESLNKYEREPAGQAH